MVRFAICDDEPQMARELAGQIAQYMEAEPPQAYCVRTFSGGRALLDSGCDYDVIFLDIRMPPPDGMETARMLRRRHAHSLLIFITILKECVFDAFAVEAYDYLLKPLDAGRFQQVMSRALGTLAQRTEQNLLVRRGASSEVIPLDEIVYCEVQGRKLYIHRRDGKVTDYYDRLENLERRVDARFFRCHRSYLVNLACVRGSQAGQVLLPQGARIPVSRLRERDLTRALLRYMKERGA